MSKDLDRNINIAKMWNDVEFAKVLSQKSSQKTAKIVAENRKEYENNHALFDREARRDEIAKCILFGEEYPEWFSTVDDGARMRIEAAAKSLVDFVYKIIGEENYQFLHSVNASVEASAKALVDMMVSTLCDSFHNNDKKIPDWETKLSPTVWRKLLTLAICEMNYSENRRKRK